MAGPPSSGAREQARVPHAASRRCLARNSPSNVGVSLQMSEGRGMFGLATPSLPSQQQQQPPPTTSSTAAAAAHLAFPAHNCVLCSFSTPSKSDLSRHMKQHTEYSLFACPHCDYRTRRSNDLKKHLRTHTGEKPYCCSFCGYRTNTTSNLKAHVRTRHVP